MSAGFEVDDSKGRWCESCLAQIDSVLASIDLPPEGHVVNYDENSGRFLCSECCPNPEAP